MLQANQDTISTSSDLFKAIKENNIEALKLILDTKEFANSEQIDKVLGEDGLSPIHLAASLGSLPIIQLLYQKGARIDVFCRVKNVMLPIISNVAPIHLAAYYGHLPVVQWLINTDKIEACTSTYLGLTPIQYAASEGHVNVIEWLADVAKIDIYHQPHDPNFLLTMCGIAAKNRFFELLKWSLNRALDASMKKACREEALSEAAENGHLDIVQWLVNNFKFDINAKSTFGKNALHLAAEKGHLHIIQYLVNEARVDSTIVNGQGYNALHLAAQNGHLNIVEWLVNTAQMNPDVLTDKGETVLFFALLKNHRDIVNALLQIGVNLPATLSVIRINPIGVQQAQEYSVYLREINTLLDFFTNPTAEKAQELNQILEYLEKYKHLKLRNEQRKTLLELMLQNICEKPTEKSGITPLVKDKLVWAFATQIIDELRIDESKDDEEELINFEKTSDFIEKLANSIKNSELKSALYLKLGERYEVLTNETGRDFTAFVIQAYEELLKVTDSIKLSQKIRLQLASLNLRLNNTISFKPNDERSQNAFYCSLFAGEDNEEAVRFRKQLLYGPGTHDDKEDPLTPKLVWEAFNAQKSQDLRKQNDEQKGKLEDFLCKANEGNNEAIATLREEGEGGQAFLKNKRSREDEEKLISNHDELGLERHTFQTSHILHLFQNDDLGTTLKKSRSDLNTEPNDTCQSAIKNVGVESGVCEDANPNNNNNNVPLRRP